MGGCAEFSAFRSVVQIFNPYAIALRIGNPRYGTSKQKT
jgi:hypothetical protein